MKKISIKQLREETKKKYGETYIQMLENASKGFAGCKVGEWCVYKCGECGGMIACEVTDLGLVPSLQACPDCGCLSMGLQAIEPYECIDADVRFGQMSRPTLEQMSLISEEGKARTISGFLMMYDYETIMREAFIGGMEAQLWRAWHKGDEECEQEDERVIFQLDLTGDFRIGTRINVQGEIFYASQGIWHTANSVRHWAYLHDLMPWHFYETRYDQFDGNK